MSTPAKDVSAYSPEELRALRERFAPLANDFRQCGRKASWYVCAALLSGGLGLLVRPHSAPVFLVLWLGAIAALVQVVRAQLPLPKCPACNARLDSVGGEFCPECGGRSLSEFVWYRFRRCGACQAKLSRGKNGRYFRIRACNHCGVLLDERGL